MLRRVLSLVVLSTLFGLGHARKTRPRTGLRTSLLKSVKTELLTMHNALERKPGQGMTLSCRSQTSEKLQYEFPYAEYRWMHNSENFQLQPIRMVYGTDSITVNGLNPLDSGSYYCQIKVSPALNIVVAVYSVVVGDVIQPVAHGDNLVLKCNSKIFGRLFNKAIRYWTNPKGKNLFAKSAKVNEETVSGTNEKMAGVWTCYVRDMATKRLWKTARVKVVVKPVPSLSQKLRIYVKNNRVKSVVIMALVIFLLVTGANTCIRCLEKRKNKFKDELEKMQQTLGIDLQDLQEKEDEVPLLNNKDDENMDESHA